MLEYRLLKWCHVSRARPARSLTLNWRYAQGYYSRVAVNIKLKSCINSLICQTNCCVFFVPIPENKENYGQIRANAGDAGVSFIRQVDPNKVVLSISRLPVIKVYGCDLMSPNGFFTEEVFDKQRIAFNV